MEGERAISDAQRRAIFGLARKAGMDHDALHDVAHRITNKDSLTEITSYQAGRIIEHLKCLTGQEAPGGWMTDAQRGAMYARCRELGWVTEEDKLDMKRLEGFIWSRFKVRKLQWLKREEAGKVLNALRAMCRRGVGEREEAKA